MTSTKSEYKEQIGKLNFMKSVSTRTIQNENIKVFHSTFQNG